LRQPLCGLTLVILQLFGTPGPAKRVAFMSVPMFDEAHDARRLGIRTTKVAMLDDPSMKNRKPDLNLVHPRCVYRRVHKFESVAMALIKL
jgi:hypothetical protein